MDDTSLADGNGDAVVEMDTLTLCVGTDDGTSADTMALLLTAAVTDAAVDALTHTLSVGVMEALPKACEADKRLVAVASLD